MPSSPTREAILGAVWEHLEGQLAARGIPLLAALSREQSLPDVAVILGLGTWVLSRPGTPYWDLSATVIGVDVFYAAKALDALEDAALSWRQGEGAAGSIRGIEYVGHDELDLDTGLVTARATLRLALVRGR